MSIRKHGTLLGGLILGLVALSNPVFAHTDLKESEPLKGQTVRKAVDRVDLVFWSPFSDPAIDVVGPDGEAIVGQTSQVDNVTARFAMDHPVTQEGEYLVRYQVRSSDADLSNGEFAFVYAPDSASGSGRASAGLIAVVAGAAVVVGWWLVARIRAQRPSPPEPV